MSSVVVTFAVATAQFLSLIIFGQTLYEFKIQKTHLSKRESECNVVTISKHFNWPIYRFNYVFMRNIETVIRKNTHAADAAISYFS